MSEKQFCSNCGFEILDPKTRFCPGCGQQVILPQPSGGIFPAHEAAHQSMPVAAAAPWDQTRLVGMNKIHAVMYIGGREERGDLELVTSGLQFASSSFIRVPYAEIRGASMVKGMSTFAIETRSGETISFKVYGAPGYARLINKMIGNPDLAKSGGIEGTPAQIRGKGGAMIGVGASLTVAGFFLTWLFIMLGVVLIISGVRYLGAAQRLELSTGK